MTFKRNPFGWHYPSGAEYDPRAPWNQKESVPDNCIECDYFEEQGEDNCWCIEGQFSLNDFPVLNQTHPDCPLED